MKRLHVTNFGPIREANVEFGDLTVLVGPQATGKSLFVQLVKAVADAGAIRKDLNDYGFDWQHGKNVEADYAAIYFGGGLDTVVRADTTLVRDGKTVTFGSVAKPAGRASPKATVFLIPAQRVLVLQDGWPKPFMAYSPGDPYCIRQFSDTVRLLMEQGTRSFDAFFPHPKRLKGALKKSIDESIYVGGRLHLATDGMRRRIVLTPASQDSSLPYGAWSAGQREFTPLLLGLYWLMPLGKATRPEAIKTVIIEEPEMGLHPQAVVTFGLLVLELMHRGYRVIVSTHSPVVLDLVWAIRSLSKLPAADGVTALCKVFGVASLAGGIEQVFRTALRKSYRTYFFHRKPGGVETVDISTLDPGDDNEDVAGWGRAEQVLRADRADRRREPRGERILRKKTRRAAPIAATAATFRAAIEAAEHLEWRAGLGALKASEGGDRVAAADTSRLLGGACIDDDCQGAHPNAARWDHVVGYARGGTPIAHFIESHSAETSEVSKMAAKLRWLLDFLQADGQSQLANLPREIHWIASGRVNIPKHTPQFKRLATTLRRDGLRLPVTNLTLT